jgi:preprotein translocase subunit SecE
MSEANSKPGDKPGKSVARSSAKTPVKKKQGFIAKTRQYLRDVVNELKKVHWPTRKELLTYTGVVLVSVAILAALTWVVDTGLAYLLNLLLDATSTGGS